MPIEQRLMPAIVTECRSVTAAATPRFDNKELLEAACPVMKQVSPLVF